MEKQNWEWYCLKYDLAESIIPKLERYKSSYMKEGLSIPTWLINEEKKSYSDKEIKELQKLWIEEIDSMIIGFKQILNYSTQTDKEMGYDEIKIQIALSKFAKYFQHFWD